MPKFSAIIYAHAADRDMLRKTLGSLQVSDEILLIDADDDVEIKKIGRQFKARIKIGIPGVTPGAYEMDTYRDWILVLRPGEAIDEQLCESLTSWRRQKHDDNPGFRFSVQEEHDGALVRRPPELRLVNRRKMNWTGELPPNTDSPSLRGNIIRYSSESEEKRIAS